MGGGAACGGLGKEKEYEERGGKGREGKRRDRRGVGEQKEEDVAVRPGPTDPVAITRLSSSEFRPKCRAARSCVALRGAAWRGVM